MTSETTSGATDANKNYILINMGLLDDDVPELWKPPEPKRYRNQTALSQEERDQELNNFDRPEVTEDYGDSPHADRI